MQVPVKQCADEVLEVIPLIMRSIRSEMRRHRDPGLTVPQFRTLAFAGRNRGTSLSELADHLGLMPPAASKIVDGLVAVNLLERTAGTTDRRCIALSLTERGQKEMENTRRIARQCLTEMFSPLSKNECGEVLSAMQKLRALFLKAPCRHRNGSAG